ncbi:MAG: PQQ-like beta-propeller repeat protein [Planctomycetaceae bacterium]|nr:PQQ-like beta-propeller repeat protein [Planctomycetaceae bacterium]
MLRSILCAFLITIFSSPLLLSADWLMFRGSEGSGKSPDAGLLKKWSEGGPKLLWTANFIGTGWSGVSISGDRIYISGNVGNLAMVFCLDKDGKEVWRKDNGPAAHTASGTYRGAGTYPGTRGTPTLDGDFVYDVSALGNVTCYNAKTGEKIWDRNILNDYEAPMPMWCFGHSVIIDGDNLISPVGGKHSAIAMDKKTGKTVWASPSAPGNVPAGYTTPYLFEFDGIRVVAVMSTSTVEGLDPKTGKTFFSIPWQNDRGVNCTIPIYHEGYLFLTNGYEGGAKLFKLAKNVEGTMMPTETWFEPRFNNHHGGVILVGDYVYGTTHKGAWGSINFMTGEVGYLSRAAGKGSAHYADGLIYGLTEDDKTVVLIKPDPKQFVLLGSFELPNDAEGKSWAHPVVLDGRLYLRHAQYLYCYDVKAQ